MRVCWQQVLLVFFLLMMSLFHFHSWRILSLDLAFWVDTCFSFILGDFCSILFKTLRFLTRSDTLIGLLCSRTPCDIFLLVFIAGFRYFWQEHALMWHSLCLCCLGLASCVCKFLSFPPLVLFCFYFSSETSHFSAEIFMHWKYVLCNRTLRRVIVTALKSFSVHSDIWFILGLNSIDSLLFRDCVPFSWFLRCWEILDCSLNNIKLWRFLSGLELQTLDLVWHPGLWFRSFVLSWAASCLVLWRVVHTFFRRVGRHTLWSPFLLEFLHYFQIL